jgi:hypothetical protein
MTFQQIIPSSLTAFNTPSRWRRSSAGLTQPSWLYGTQRTGCLAGSAATLAATAGGRTLTMPVTSTGQSASIPTQALVWTTEADLYEAVPAGLS